jgi:hypothetical protein
MRSIIVVFLLIIYNALSGQQTGAGILSDSAKLAEYMYIHMHYPLMAMVDREEGTAVYKFVTDSVRGFGEMRVIKRMPPWKPGKINGKPVRVYYVLPINICM